MGVERVHAFGPKRALLVALVLAALGCDVLSDESTSQSNGLSVGTDGDQPVRAPTPSMREGAPQPTQVVDRGAEQPSAEPAGGSAGTGDVAVTPDTPVSTQAPEHGAPPRLPPCGAIDPGAAAGAGMTLALEWQWHTAPLYELALPLVANLDDDNGDGAVDVRDTPDVVVASMNAPAVFLLDGASGTPKLTLPAQPPYGSLPALGDLDRDGVPEIVAFDDLTPVAFDARGNLLWRAPKIDENTGTGTLTLSDLDQDGSVEVISDGVVFDAAGEHVATLTVTGNPAAPVAADLDGDGTQELLYGGGAWRLDGSQYYAIDDVARGFPEVADFDGDGLPEIVLVSETDLVVVEHDGRERKRVSITETPDLINDATLAPALIADLDGDGRLEIGVAGEHFYRVYRSDLSLLWSAEAEHGAYVWGATAFDFDGDGVLEIAYADQVSLHVFDGATGAERHRYPLPGMPGLGYPVIADVDNDGSAEILMVVRKPDNEGSVVLALGAAQGRFMPARRIWNQYEYYVTNVSETGQVASPERGSWLQANTFRVQAQVGADGEPCAPAKQAIDEGPN